MQACIKYAFMLELRTAKLLDDLDAIVAANQAYLDIQAAGQPELNRATLTELRDHAASICAQCGDLGLLGTQGAASDLIAWLDKALAMDELFPHRPQVIPRDIFVRILNHLREVPQIIRRESAPRRFFMIAPEYQRFYEPQGYLFGAEVDIAFEEIRYDLAEVGKCLALERSTAAVYHLVRCLEAGLRAIARCLGIPEPKKGHDQSCGSILGAIRADLFRRWPDAVDRFKGDGRIFEELYGSLAAFKTPYRDSTMHLQEKYTEKEARYFFEMIRGLMTKISERMDARGRPVA
jgi:hypothetical protein